MRAQRWAGALALVALAGILGLRHLGTKPLWLDETVSVSVARRPWTRMAEVLTHHDANAGLYYLFLHLWLHFGHGVAWTRAPGVVFFAATAGLATVVGYRWRGTLFGLVCGSLVATNSFLLFYAQEARPYSLAVLLGVASTAALFARRGEPAPGWYVGATIALLYADLFAVLFVAAQTAVVVVVHRRRHQRLPAVLTRSWAAIAAGTAPLAVYMMLRERSQISWLTPPTLLQLGRTFLSMASGWAGLVIIAGLVWLAWRATGRAVPAGGPTAWDRDVVPVLLAAAVVPPVVLWTFAQAVPSFLDRYVICATVAMLGLAAMGIDSLRRRAGVVVAAAVAVILCVVGLNKIVGSEAHPYKYENIPAVVAFVSGRTRAGDGVGFDGGGLRTAIDTYLPAHRPFPLDVALAPGGAAELQPDLYAREVAPSVLEARLASVGRLWIITDPSSGRYPTIAGALVALRSVVLRDFTAVQTTAFPGIDVTLYDRAP